MEQPVLITGFGPFRGHPVNASWESVQYLKENFALNHGGQSIPMEIREIPVEYNYVSSEIPKLWAEVKPRLCVHVGVAGGSNSIRLEKYGRNVGYHSLDVVNAIPVDNVCVQGGPDHIQTCCDMDKVYEQAVKRIPDMNFTVSKDAGRYLCDFTYYTSLHTNCGPVVFVHVPALGKPYTKEQIAFALKHVIECLIDQLV